MEKTDIDRWHDDGGIHVETPKVLICTSLGESKLYALSFLLTAVRALQASAGILIVLDGISAPDGFAEQLQANETLLELPPVSEDTDWKEYAPARISRVREASRQAFLEGDWTHLYWHDSDMIPPPDILTRLLAHDKPLASGLYNLRHNEGLCLPTTVQANAAVPPAPMRSLVGLPAEGDGYSSATCGMGCLLIRRDLLEATGFVEPEHVFAIRGYEDVLWCLESKTRVFMDISLLPWHVEPEGTARRLVVGEPEFGVVWTDSHALQNRLGEWRYCVPRYDLNEEDIATLGPGFVQGHYPRLSIEQKRIEDIK